MDEQHSVFSNDFKVSGDETIESTIIMDNELIECSDLFNEYRKECEKWLIDDDNNPNHERSDQQADINLLKSMVRNLLDQNECLVENLIEIKKESIKRMNELRRNLQTTAERTEEVMLSLESHELSLKNFVQKHCCECCACDMRLMEFKLCHGIYCDYYNYNYKHNHNHDHHPRNSGTENKIRNGSAEIQSSVSSSSSAGSSPSSLSSLTEYLNNNDTINNSNNNHNTFNSRCWSFGHLWNSVFYQTSHWFSNRELFPNDYNKCVHNLNSEMRFLNIVDLIDNKLHQLLNENDTLKKENQMIRELNSLLSCRNGPPLLLDDIKCQSHSNKKSSCGLINSNISLQSSSNHNNNNININGNNNLELPQFSSSSFDSFSSSLSPISRNDRFESESDEQELIHGQYYTASSLEDGGDSLETNEMLMTFFSNANNNNDSHNHNINNTINNNSNDHHHDQVVNENGVTNFDLSFECGRQQHDNDSGCSTDLIPSQTDMQSLLALSDLDDDGCTSGSTSNDDNINNNNNNQIIKNLLTSINLPTTKKDDDLSEDNHQPTSPQLQQRTNQGFEVNELENLKNRVDIADKLIPKLYNKLLYYMNQRNLLLEQFRQENRAREKCKRELSTLTECLMENLKFIETKAKTNNNNNNKSNVLCL